MSQPVLLQHDAESQAHRIWQARGPGSAWAADGLRGSGDAPLPRIALLLIGDGRDELRHATVSSFLAQLYGYALGGVVEVDDRRHEMGFGGAIRAGWHALRTIEVDGIELRGERPWDYVFHLEEDWRFLEPIDVRWLVAILDGHERAGYGLPPPVPGMAPLDFPRIAQAALKRGAVNAQERQAGGIVEQWPAEYLDAGVVTEDGATPYLQHRLFWTTNPSLYRTETMMLGWPEGAGSEASFTRELLGWGYAFAFYGTRAHPPTIEHTGAVRTGGGY